MRSLRELLTTWENWSARDTLTQAIGRASSDEAREALRRALNEAPEVDPLDALRDVAELVSLLSGWQWQAMYAARAVGSTWDEIGAVIGTEGKICVDLFLSCLDRQERLAPGSTRGYRVVVQDSV